MNNKALNILKTTSFTIAAASLVLFIYALIVGDNLALPWQVDNAFKTRPLLLEYFQLNGQAAGLYVDQIISWQKYFTGDIQYLVWPETLLFIVFFIVLITVSTVVTYLDRFTYFIVSGVVVFVLIQLRLEELGIAESYLTYAVIGGFALLSYLFQSFFPNSGFGLRITANLLFYGILLGIIMLGTNITHPHLVTISFGIMGPVILATIFIVFIAGDNIFSLFKLTTQGTGNGKDGLKHFFIIGLIYVSITILIFLQRTGYTEFDIYLVNPYVLLVISMISGYLCLDKKLHAVAGNMDFRFVKNWLYPIGCSLTLVLIAFAQLTLNDSITNAIAWVIIISHMTFGLVFLFYALVNFATPLAENLEIWPIFFQGLRAPILIARFMAFVMFLGGVFYLNNRPYYQVKAGQYGMLAALGEKIQNPLLADQYYRQSVFYDFYNFKANYSLSRIAKRADEVQNIPSKLNTILNGAINPKARVAYANYFADRDLLYRELTALMNSRESDDNLQAKNNLGLSHYRYSNYDSAYKYFVTNQKAISVVSEGNLAALNYDLAAQIKFDTAVNYQHTDDINVMINRQALANAQNDIIPYNLSLNPDTLLTKSELFYLYNAALNQSDKDKTFVLSAIDYYLASRKNDQFNNFLLMARAVGYYNQGSVNEAFRTLERSIASSQSAVGFPYFAKAIWAFDQGQAALTIESLENARKSGYYEPQVKPFVEALNELNDYSEKADVSMELQEVLLNKDNLESAVYINSLLKIADLNAFDVTTTLAAIEKIRLLDESQNDLYDLLRTAIQINPNSTKLLEEYIYQCARAGFSSFAKTALNTLNPMISADEFIRVQEKFEALQEIRRNSLILKE